MADWTEKYIRDKQRFTAKMKRRRERARAAKAGCVPDARAVFFSHPQRDPRPMGDFNDL